MNDKELEPLIRDDGSSFTESEVQAYSHALSELDKTSREGIRNRNADAIAGHEAARMLIVSGPGTGKSTLFKSRLKYWLKAHPECRVAVATFVKKLVVDLKGDISTDTENFSPQDRARITVRTLHSLARGIVEQSRGTLTTPMAPNIQVATEFWESVIWGDVFAFHSDRDPSDYPWERLRGWLYDAKPITESDWSQLRASHRMLQQFYNALTFPDQIIFATESALERPEPLANTLFIVDEYQDFNLAEDAYVRAVIQNSKGVLLVGDDDQVLYEFRNGHAKIIRGYNDDPGFVNAMLPLCGRCSGVICRTAEAFLSADRPAESIHKVFVPIDAGNDASKVAVVASTNPSAESWIRQAVPQ